MPIFLLRVEEFGIVLRLSFLFATAFAVTVALTPETYRVSAKAYVYNFLCGSVLLLALHHNNKKLATEPYSSHAAPTIVSLPRHGQQS